VGIFAPQRIDVSLCLGKGQETIIGLKIVHDFKEQRLGGFHEIRPASLKLK
jgi:hypothetical protein